MEFSVCSRDLEAFGFGAVVVVVVPVVVVETEDELVAFDDVFCELRAVRYDVCAAVVVSEGVEGQSSGDDLLFVGMDVVEVADVGGGDEGGVLFLLGELVLSEAEPIVLVVEGGELNKIDLEVGILEFLLPAIIEGLHLVGVDLVFEAVLAALVPDHASYGVGYEGIDHGVPEDGGLFVEPGDGAKGHALVPFVGDGILGEGFERRVILVAGSGRPGVDVGAAPAGVDDADGDLKTGVELQGVVKSDGGDGLLVGALVVAFCNSFPGEGTPLAVNVFFGLDVPGPVWLDEADVVVLSDSEHHLAVSVAVTHAVVPQGAFHVALSGGEPDFADEDVFNFDFFLGIEGPYQQRPRLFGSVHGREGGFPIAIVVGFGFGYLFAESYFKAFLGIGGAPDGDGHFALENSMVLEGRAELDFS